MSNHDKPGLLDGAIDQAVRDMMQVDARPGLRFRVARAITAPPPRRRRLRFGLAAIGLTSAALFSVLLLRPAAPAAPVHAPQVAETTSAAHVTSLAEPQAVRATPVASIPAPSSAQSRRRPLPTSDSIFGPRRDRVAAANVRSAGVAAVDFDAWPEPAQDNVGRFGITPIMVEPIRVAPLAIQPLFAGTAPPPRR